ncbi:MAG: sensor domain-containing diguanylate cyclase [Proteobacteria bacterium]|nr:sensor domain-containing diguanylate cyclase [Pseudomonadota bacterium]
MVLRRRLERERLARKQAEQIAEENSRALFLKGEDLESALALERKTRKEIETLLSALETFTAKLNTAEIVKCLHQFLYPVVASSSTTLYLWQDNSIQIINIKQDSETDPVISFCDEEQSLKIWRRFSKQNKPSVIECCPQENTVGGLLTIQPGSRFILILPLTAQGRIIGFFTAETPEAGVFNDSNIIIASALANEASVALENAMLFREVERLSLTDPLTGLMNRRGFEGDARRSIDIAIRYKHPLSVLMLDIDYFKRVNDTYGHAMGDKVLAEIAHICLKGMRSTDLLARFGGEEFCFLLPETNAENAMLLAERLRVAICAMRFETDAQSFSVTVSIGISECVAKDSLENLLVRSDEALYKAKNTGRNRALLWSLSQ